MYIVCISTSRPANVVDFACHFLGKEINTFSNPMLFLLLSFFSDICNAVAVLSLLPTKPQVWLMPLSITLICAHFLSPL